jgi:hypothetical protein
MGRVIEEIREKRGIVMFTLVDREIGTSDEYCKQTGGLPKGAFDQV